MTTNYGKKVRPCFRYRADYVGVLPCLRWPKGQLCQLGTFGSWFRRERVRQGLRIDPRYDTAMPKLRKSQRRAWRRFRFEANRDLRLQRIRDIRPAPLRDCWEYNHRGKAVFYASAVRRNA